VPLQFLLYSRGKLRLSQGDIPGALADFRELERRRQDGHLTPFGISGTSLALLAAGERDQAQAEADRNLARAVDWGAPSAVGMALRTSGVVEGGARGLDRLREAVTVLEASPARLEHARALVSLGGQLRRLGRRAEARDPLRRGLHLATLCGAPVVAERALLELRAAGGRPRKPTLTGIHALTATERRVADMAARGLSNREIAQALFVTTRTVEGHLTHAYQKLGITSRVELDMSLSGNSHRARHP
jgi:DNA-binding CsgD family transcriptional regulator